MKILIIGIVASGKTTLAKMLERQLNVKHYEIDSLGIEKCNYKPTIKMLKQMYKWTNNYEKEREERENQLNDYAHKLIKIRNTKEWKECIKNEYSKAKKKQ